jgi:hypothetical protein
MINIVCVNWGKKYGTAYTQRLYNMVKRNTNKEFKFFCLTDQVDVYSEPIIPVPLQPGFSGWWNKMQLFKDNVLPPGEYLYFDLDVVIVDNIDCLLEWPGFGIPRDFINPDNGLTRGKEYNSSVMRFTQNMYLWNFYVDNIEFWQKAQIEFPFLGDQHVISAYLNKAGYASPFPDHWLWSYKIGVLRGRRPVDHSKLFGEVIPPEGKVCIFHGSPNPDEVQTEWVKAHWR